MVTTLLFVVCLLTLLWVGIAKPVQRLATGWTVRGSNPDRGEIFRTCPDRPWGPPILLYNGYRVSFPGVKPPGRGVDHPPPSNAEVKEIVDLYLYSPFRPSWPVLEWPLPLAVPLPLLTLSLAHVLSSRRILE
jgi:hypothetical protein